MPSGIAELIRPTSGTVQTTMEPGVLSYIRGAGNSYYLPLLKCTRDVKTGSTEYCNSAVIHTLLLQRCEGMYLLAVLTRFDMLHCTISLSMLSIV